MWMQIAAGAFLVGQFIYHRWIEDDDVEDVPPREFRVPRSSEGSPIPLIYGRCRVRAPVLAWCRVLTATSSGANVQLLFICGIPMNDGDSTTKIFGMWEGDNHITWTTDPATYPGHPPAALSVSGALGTYGPHVEIFDGNSAQTIALDGDTVFGGAQPCDTWLGRHMLEIMSTDDIPGLRGYISIYLHNFVGSPSGWLAPPGSLASYSFDVYSVADGGSQPAPGVYAMIGADANPANVIYDLLKAKLGKMGLDTSLIDFASFQSAGYTLYTESHGYSRAIEEASEADTHIAEILEQIDGTLDENPVTGKIRLKLIRNDYDPNDIPHITKANCFELQNLSVGGWQGIPNKFRVVYTNRDDEYNDGSKISHNAANAVGQDGLVREQVIRYPGCTFASLAQSLADREKMARSRPIIKLRAIVDRSFLNVMRGDAVKLTWNDPDIGGLVFRVADVNRGTLSDGKIALDLIQDYYYVWRNQIPVDVVDPPTLPDLPSDMSL